MAVFSLTKAVEEVSHQGYANMAALQEKLDQLSSLQVTCDILYLSLCFILTTCFKLTPVINSFFSTYWTTPYKVLWV
jgi:hypothetical protein